MTLEDRGSIAYTGDNAASVWYLAYGSNLNATKFLHDRQITPISQVNVEIPGWVLTLDSAGVPYSEPSFASMSVCSGRFVAGEKVPCLVGIAYELTRDMYRKVIASEGGGIAYAEVEVRAKRIDPMCASNSTPIETFAVRGLVTLMPRAASPSQRYMVSSCSLNSRYLSSLICLHYRSLSALGQVRRAYQNDIKTISRQFPSTIRPPSIVRSLAPSCS